MVRMKPKMHPQVQPWDIVPPQSARGHNIPAEVEEEIQTFLQAVKSYPSRAAKEPRITFQRHITSIFAARNEDEKNDRRDIRPRRR